MVCWSILVDQWISFELNLMNFDELMGNWKWDNLIIKEFKISLIQY